MTPSTLVGWIVIGVAVLTAVGLALVVTLAALLLTGGPNLAPVCGDRTLDLAPSPDLSFDTRWDGFDSFLETGVPDALDLEEGVVTARARAFLEAEPEFDAIHDVVICFFGPPDAASLGYAEVRGRVDLPAGSGIGATIRGRIDLGGTQPVLDLTRMEVGNLPVFLTAGVQEEIEDAVNAALAGVDLQHHYNLEFREGFARIIGQPR